MKVFRLLAIAAAACAVLLLLAVAVAFNSSFQTWAVRRTLAKQSNLRATIGSVSAGLKKVTVADARFERDGATLTVPRIEADLPVIAAGFGDRLAVSRFVAKGWTLDLSKVGHSAGQQNDLPSGRVTDPPFSTHPATTTSAATRRAFAGIFGLLRLPVDVTADNVDLEGEVILPEERGRTKVTIRGGGLAPRSEGKFQLSANIALADPKVSAVKVQGALAATMDTSRTFTHIAARFDADATGTQFPNGVRLAGELAAARGATGETYSGAVFTPQRQLLAIDAQLPNGARQLDGAWKLDVHQDDVSPFALGKPLPNFTAVGHGKFDADASFTAVRAIGALTATADKLERVKPELATVGPVKLTADFDLAHSGDTLAVSKLTADLSAERPVAHVESLQPFHFNPKTAELKALDPESELVTLVLHGLPIVWAKEFLSGVTIEGGDLRGELGATARGGGVTVRSKAPLMADGVSVAEPDKPIVAGVDVALEVSGDYTPAGWQAEVTRLSANIGETTIIMFDAKAGQLAGRDQPLKATGRISVDLPTLLKQPLARSAMALTRGEATLEFATNLAAKKEFQTKIAVKNLAVDEKENQLPSIAANVRVDIAADGKAAIYAPIRIEMADRASDIALAGSFTPGKPAATVDARVTSNHFAIDDAKLLAAIVPTKKAGDETKTAAAEAPWAGLKGRVALQLKKVVYAGSFEATDVTGTLRLDAGTLKLETVRAGVGERGEAKLSAAVTFDPAVNEAFGLEAELAMTDFDPGPVFRAMNPEQPPTVEGRFNIASTHASRAPTLGELAAGAGGDFHITSRGGVFRGLPVNASNLAENTNRITAWIASAGATLGNLTGKKDYSDIANKAQAVAEIAKALNPIAYDQLSVMVSRDARLNTELKDFALISPEIRLTGSGEAIHRDGTAMLDDELSMEYTLRARGRQGELLRFLGLLETQPDDLGYAACTLPLKVSGTLGAPDTSELNQQLATLAIDKSGLGDKAAELLQRLRGGKSGE